MISRQTFKQFIFLLIFKVLLIIAIHSREAYIKSCSKDASTPCLSNIGGARACASIKIAEVVTKICPPFFELLKKCTL
jgi:hypothetical protein